MTKPADFVTFPLKVLINTHDEIVDSMGVAICPTVYGKGNAHFLASAANHCNELMEIVKEIVDKSTYESDLPLNFLDIITSCENLIRRIKSEQGY